MQKLVENVCHKYLDTFTAILLFPVTLSGRSGEDLRRQTQLQNWFYPLVVRNLSSSKLYQTVLPRRPVKEISLNCLDQQISKSQVGSNKFKYKSVSG